MALLTQRLNRHTHSGQMLLDALPRLTRDVPYYRMHRTAYQDPMNLPVMTRAGLARVPFQLLVPDTIDAAAELTRGTAAIMSTSGSTSEPLRTLLDTEATVSSEYWSLWGIPGTPRFACLTSPACMGEKCGLSNADRTTRQPNPDFLFFPSTRALFSEPDDFFRTIALEWADFQPEVLVANPVYLHWALRRFRALELDYPKPKVLLCSYQYLSHCQRRALSQVAPIASDYGATELAGTGVAMGCPQGHLHVLTSRVHLEQRPFAGLEHAGELLISTPGSRTSPLIRYSPGDLGRLLPPTQSPCAMNALPTLELWGRIADCLHAPNRLWTTREVDDALEPLHWLELYTVRQRDDGALDLSLVADPAPTDAVPQVTSLFEQLGFRVARARLVERLTLSAALKLQLTDPDGVDEP